MSSAPTRVARIITRLNVGGPARHALLLTRGLEEQGFATDLLVGAQGPREGALSLEGVVPTIVPALKRSIDPVSEIRAARSLHRAIRSFAPQIVHTHMAKAGFHGRRAANRAGVPVVIHTFHGHVLEGYFSAPVNAALVSLERRLAKRTDALLAVSPLIRDELLDLGIGSPDRWHVMPLGLDLDRLLEVPMEKTSARAELGLPQDAPIVGIVGRLVPIKDVDTFLDAARLVARERPDVHFVVAGDGELREALEERGRAELGERIHFLGWVMDLAPLYGALDVVVLTSKNEGTPVALIEAAAAGLPAVATHVGGVGDVVRDGTTGFLITPGDAEGVASRVTELIEAPELRRQLGREGRAHVRTRFTQDRLINDMAELYRDLLARKRLDGRPWS